MLRWVDRIDLVDVSLAWGTGIFSIGAEHRTFEAARERGIFHQLIRRQQERSLRRLAVRGVRRVNLIEGPILGDDHMLPVPAHRQPRQAHALPRRFYYRLQP